MKRRPKALEIVEPPARLRVFDPAEWPVDPTAYVEDDHRNRNENGPYGLPRMSAGDWVAQEQHNAWCRARHAWLAEHGWPGDLTYLDLMYEELALRRARVHPPTRRGALHDHGGEQ